MNPVWKEFPDIPWGSVGWRMGHGEVYWQTWAQWFKAISDTERGTYKVEWPEPEAWSGFYRFIELGELPPWVIEKRKAEEAFHIPPKKDEIEIREWARIKWLARSYFEKTFARDPDEYRMHDIYREKGVGLWKFIHAPSDHFEPPYFVRFEGRAIGTDNVPINRI
jgi:hypothetical protein